ncbi:MAG: Coq4 family protein [Deltaproteobacteria bacterium]|nr:Coq4 family protein [Deltaproteobacteria bacterium]
MTQLATRGYDLPRAHQAVRALLTNPDDLPRVFDIIESLSGDTLDRIQRSLKRSESGRDLLATRPDIVDFLGDRAWLRSLPEGSLGRAYLRFVEHEGISAQGIRDASLNRENVKAFTEEQQWIRNRLRDTHDLWHAVTGYHGDVAGELALLAFTFAQEFNPSIALIVIAALTKGLGRKNVRLIAGGYRDGRRAAKFVAIRWEDLLARPLAEVQRELSVSPAPSYEEIRTSVLRAEGKLAPATA